MSDHPQRPNYSDELSPLQRRAIEVDVAAAFHEVLAERLGPQKAEELFSEVVERLAAATAAGIGDGEAPAEHPLERLWRVWAHLGAEGRLDLHLDELSESRLRFHVGHCAYAEMYRAKGLEEIGVLFSCRRDAPFARALVPGVHVEQSRTILEGADRCEFTYTLEEQ